MKSISSIAKNIDGQPMFKYLDMAKQLEREGKELIHLEIGEPDFDTPKNISLAAIKSISNGQTHYTSSYGTKEFREAIQFATERSRGFKPDINQVLVTPGANISIYYAILCLVNPGEEVIVPDPGFSTYYSVAKMCGTKAIPIPLKEENDFKIKAADIEKAITDKTRLIIINSPSNPTGSVLNIKELKEIYELAKKYDLYLYSDEIYARMCYENSFISPSIFDECKEHVIVSNGFSKSFAMTGWRLGVVIAPEIVIERMASLLQTTSSCVAKFIQDAGIEAIYGSQHEVTTMLQLYKERRDILVKGLNSVKGFNCVNPGGAFYVFPSIKDTGLTSDEVVTKLLNAGVVSLPGHCFGAHGAGYIRLCYANSKENIEKAVEIIKKVFGEK